MAAMTREELAALIAEHAHTFQCGGCGSNWVVPKSGVAILYHVCPQTRGSPVVASWNPGSVSIKPRETWARGVLGDSLADAVEHRDGTDALLRPTGDQ